jgi:hypothetical protein
MVTSHLVPVTGTYCSLVTRNHNHPRGSTFGGGNHSTCGGIIAKSIEFLRVEKSTGGWKRKQDFRRLTITVLRESSRVREGKINLFHQVVIIFNKYNSISSLQLPVPTKPKKETSKMSGTSHEALCTSVLLLWFDLMKKRGSKTSCGCALGFREVVVLLYFVGLVLWFDCLNGLFTHTLSSYEQSV